MTARHIAKEAALGLLMYAAFLALLFAGAALNVLVPMRDAWRRFVKRHIVDDYPWEGAM